MGFEKATKQQAKLRLSIVGPSGAGKTMTSLRIAAGIGGPIGVIDSERRSACKYADRFDFEVSELNDKTVDGYAREIRGAGDKFNVLIVDSLSHAWQELLEQVDKLAKAKYRGNTWSAWSEGTPKQKMLIDTILNCPCHIIATMRSKTSWSEEKDERTGKIRPVKVGLAPEQGKNIEYEFDMMMEMTTDHIATISKDRTGKFQDSIIEKPGEDFGKALVAWLSDGEVQKAAAVPGEFSEQEKKLIQLTQLIAASGFDAGFIVNLCKAAKVNSLSDMDLNTLGRSIDYVEKSVAKREAAKAAA